MPRILAGRATLTGLWRHSDFVKLWLGRTVSRFGSHIGGTALSLTAIILLGATPAQMGLLAALEAAPILVVGLVAGVWVDRLRRRPLMVAADLGRAALLTSIPLAALLGHRVHRPAHGRATRGRRRVRDSRHLRGQPAPGRCTRPSTGPRHREHAGPDGGHGAVGRPRRRPAGRSHRPAAHATARGGRHDARVAVAVLFASASTAQTAGIDETGIDVVGGPRQYNPRMTRIRYNKERIVKRMLKQWPNPYRPPPKQRNIDTPTMRLAASLWAQLRQQGTPTAAPKELDGDVILAAQTRLLRDAGHAAVVATSNVGHLARLASAHLWHTIT